MRLFPFGTVVRFIPNVITVLALAAGLLSIRYSLEYKWHKAVLYILLAAMCDVFDGKVARMINSESDFGKELDSLADLVNFGVAPSILIYLNNLCVYSKIGWAACQMFIICQALRLARFNTMSIHYHKYFIGVPAPAGALLLILPIITEFCFKVRFHTVIVLINTILISLALISTLETPSLKEANMKNKSILIVLLCIIFISNMWLTIWFISIIYIIYIVVKNINKLFISDK